MKPYIAGAVVFVVLCFMFRWEIIPVTGSTERLGYAYLLNRFTGEVQFLHGTTIYKLEKAD